LTAAPRPLHRFGQHLLIDRRVLTEIVAASTTDPQIPVIEIGAGTGVLTQALAKARQAAVSSGQPSAAPLIAVEIDQRLIPLLTERVKGLPHTMVVHADILKMPVEELLTAAHCPRPTAYDVIGNIPYNITAPILKKFLAHEPRPRRMTLLLDEAVADVLVAEPPHVSIRAISVQVYAIPTVIRRRIPPSAFVPPPAVHSAIVSLATRPEPLIPAEDERAFFRLVRAGFSQKRKTLANALAATYRLKPSVISARLRAASIEPTRRAQTSSIDEWKNLLSAWEREEKHSNNRG
jgi:16S rRNA (adenine1518-N6/adenine1519-N6)-dimethyltransferase